MRRAVFVSCLVLLGCGGESRSHPPNGEGVPDAGSASGGSGGTGPSGGTGATAGNSACGDTNVDPHNCGTCGNVCGYYCSHARCVSSVAVAQWSAGCVAVEGTHVYWGTGDFGAGVGSLWRSELAGGPAELVASGMPPLSRCDLVVDATHAYVSTEWMFSSGLGSDPVLEVALGSGEVSVLAEGSPQALAVDARYVYFAERESAIRRLPIGGGPTTTLASEGGWLGGFAIDASHAYWTAHEGGEVSGTVMSVPLDGGEVTTLATGHGTSSGLAVDDEYLYFTDSDGGNLWRMPKRGGPVDLMLANLVRPGALALDATDLYVAAEAGGIFRLATTGSEAVQVASVGSAFDLATSATSLFLTTGSEILAITPR